MAVAFEAHYRNLVQHVLQHGETRHTRNGVTKAIFGAGITFDLSAGYIPVLTGRKMFYKGVLGELAAMLRQPKHINDFEKWGCNYWKDWADEDGSIRVDYGNKWYDFHGINQMEQLLDSLRYRPMDRRHIITGWDPSSRDLSLPCCHLLYQFYVDNNDRVHMIWYQRSVDTMVGLPSDAIFASAMLLYIAAAADLKVGSVQLVLADTHIYKEHFDDAYTYLNRPMHTPPKYEYTYTGLFRPDDLRVYDYQHEPVIKFKLKA